MCLNLGSRLASGCQFCYHYGMEITIDKLGRLVVPKSIRDRFHLVPGTVLKLEVDASGIRISPIAEEPSLIWKDGVLVHHGPETELVDVRQVIERERENRNADIAAESGGWGSDESAP